MKRGGNENTLFAVHWACQPSLPPPSPAQRVVYLHLAPPRDNAAEPQHNEPWIVTSQAHAAGKYYIVKTRDNTHSRKTAPNHRNTNKEHNTQLRQNEHLQNVSLAQQFEQKTRNFPQQQKIDRSYTEVPTWDKYIQKTNKQTTEPLERWNTLRFRRARCSPSLEQQVSCLKQDLLSPAGGYPRRGNR